MFLLSSFSCLCPIHSSQVKLLSREWRIHLSDQQFYCLLRCGLQWRLYVNSMVSVCVVRWLVSNYRLIWMSIISTNLWDLFHQQRSANPWWRHQMEKFSALLALCAGNSPVTSEFPSQRPVTCCFDVFFYRRLNKRLSKQSWSWWFETTLHSLWRHSNEYYV